MKDILSLVVLLVAGFILFDMLYSESTETVVKEESLPTNGVFDKERLQGSAAREYMDEQEKPLRIDMPRSSQEVSAPQEGRALPKSYYDMQKKRIEIESEGKKS